MRQEKSWTNEEDKYLQDNYLYKSESHIAEKLGRTKRAIERRRDYLFLPMRLTEYALYRDEEFLTSGTAKEIAAEREVKISTVYRYKNQHEGRLRLYKLGGNCE